MKIISDEKLYEGPGTALVLGMFDGVHLGHRALIRRAVDIARSRDLDAMVCTFDRHPLEVLRPEAAPNMLMTLEERLAAFAGLGVDWALVKPFTREFSQVEPNEYLESLVAATRTRAVVVGENYTFGRGGRGNAAMIRARAEDLGYEPVVIKSVAEAGKPISSTRIRRLISEGRLERALQLLGRADRASNAK